MRTFATNLLRHRVFLTLLYARPLSSITHDQATMNQMNRRRRDVTLRWFPFVCANASIRLQICGRNNRQSSRSKNIALNILTNSDDLKKKSYFLRSIAIIEFEDSKLKIRYISIDFWIYIKISNGLNVIKLITNYKESCNFYTLL